MGTCSSNQDVKLVADPGKKTSANKAVIKEDTSKIFVKYPDNTNQQQ